MFAPKQKVTVKRFVVTVVYDPRDVSENDPSLPHLVHHAMLENGPEMVWDEVYADEVVLGPDETCGDAAASVHAISL